MVMRMLLYALLGGAAAIYLSLCAFLYSTQRTQMYFPTAESHHADVPTLRVESAGASLKIWALGARASDPAADALIYFGGNGEDVAGNIAEFSLAFADRAVYLVNYRGYGGSSGSPTEQGLFADSEAVFDLVRARHPDAAIAVMGRSLGSGVAIHLAAARAVERLVLVTPFDSLINVAREHFPWFPMALLMRDRYESIEQVRSGRVRTATFIVIAQDDEVVPAARGEALAAAFPAGQARVLRINGATHNSIGLFPQYLQSVTAFLSQRASPTPG